MFYVSCMCGTLREDKDIFFIFFLAQFTTPVIQLKKKISECAMDSVFWPFTIMSVDFEGGRGKTVRACLHLVTLWVLSDRISIWFVTFGHIKNRYKSDLELGLPHYHVKEINSALHFIHHQPITRSKIATGESGISTGKIALLLVSLAAVCALACWLYPWWCV